MSIPSGGSSSVTCTGRSISMSKLLSLTAGCMSIAAAAGRVAKVTKPRRASRPGPVSIGTGGTPGMLIVHELGPRVKLAWYSSMRSPSDMTAIGTPGATFARGMMIRSEPGMPSGRMHDLIGCSVALFSPSCTLCTVGGPSVPGAQKRSSGTKMSVAPLSMSMRSRLPSAGGMSAKTPSVASRDVCSFRCASAISSSNAGGYTADAADASSSCVRCVQFCPSTPAKTDASSGGQTMTPVYFCDLPPSMHCASLISFAPLAFQSACIRGKCCSVG